MEILLVLGLIGVLFLIATGKALWLWLGLLFIALVVGYRAYRLRCRNCGRSLISGRHMKFCNQCGSAQKSRGIKLRCESCGRMTRYELNMNYCNRCGAAAAS
jgi:rRNA maturation endonuclease Nob1